MRGEVNYMAWTIYVLQSDRDGGYYIGCTSNLVRRLEEHNAGLTKSLKYRTPLRVIHTELCKTQSEAYAREKQIKKYKGGVAFKKLIGL